MKRKILKLKMEKLHRKPKIFQENGNGEKASCKTCENVKSTMYQSCCLVTSSWVQNFGDEGLALLLSLLRRLQEDKDEYP